MSIDSSPSPERHAPESPDPSLIENAVMRQELARLNEENEDLRASARWWILLYEAALERANAYEAWLAAPDPTRQDTGTDPDGGSADSGG